MNAKLIQAAIDTFEQWEGFANESLVPCTDQEIGAMTALLPRRRIPEAYRELLAYAGQKFGGVYRVVDISYRMVWTLLSHGNRDVVEMLTAWDEKAALSPEMFILNQHLGAAFTFIRLDEGDDPPVYSWKEGSGGLEAVVRVSAAFSSFLLGMVQEYIEYRQDMCREEP